MCGPGLTNSTCMAEGGSVTQASTKSHRDPTDVDPDEQVPRAPLPSGCRCGIKSGVDLVSARAGRSSGYYCEKDLYIQVETFAKLLTGCFYFSELNSAEAKQTLKLCPVGTFIVRNSSDPRYLYTVSVKTKRGPTSIRIFYDKGQFSLDADEKSKSKMPKFSSLLELLDYYIRLTAAQQSEQCRFVDRSGKKDLPIILSSPKLRTVPTLKHMSRVSINRSLQAGSAKEILEVVSSLPLPPRLKSYIKDYPYLH